MVRFTKEEKIILLFLAATLFIGAGILYYKGLNPANQRFLRSQNISFEEKINPAFALKDRVNLNKATKEDLVEIKGIGPVLAGRIISYREKYGLFRKIEDIKEIKGIGGKTFEKIRKGLTLE